MQMIFRPFVSDKNAPGGRLLILTSKLRPAVLSRYYYLLIFQFLPDFKIFSPLFVVNDLFGFCILSAVFRRHQAPCTPPSSSKRSIAIETNT